MAPCALVVRCRRWVNHPLKDLVGQAAVTEKGGGETFKGRNRKGQNNNENRRRREQKAYSGMLYEKVCLQVADMP